MIKTELRSLHVGTTDIIFIQEFFRVKPLQNALSEIYIQQMHLDRCLDNNQ